MPLSFSRKDSPLSVIIISGSCCIPGMAPLDEQARRIVEQAISETGVAAQVRVIPASNAMFGAVPPRVMAKLMSEANQGRIPLPAILINGGAVSYGVPAVEDVKSALLRTGKSQEIRKEQTT